MNFFKSLLYPPRSVKEYIRDVMESRLFVEKYFPRKDCIWYEEGGVLSDYYQDFKDIGPFFFTSLIFREIPHRLHMDADKHRMFENYYSKSVSEAIEPITHPSDIQYYENNSKTFLLLKQESYLAKIENKNNQLYLVHWTTDGLLALVYHDNLTDKCEKLYEISIFEHYPELIKRTKVEYQYYIMWQQSIETIVKNDTKNNLIFKTTNETSNGIHSLPLEIVFNILRELSVDSIGSLSRLNKLSYNYFQQERIWEFLYKERICLDINFTLPSNEKSWKILFKRKYSATFVRLLFKTREDQSLSNSGNKTEMTNLFLEYRSKMKSRVIKIDANELFINGYQHGFAF